MPVCARCMMPNYDFSRTWKTPIAVGGRVTSLGDTRRPDEGGPALHLMTWPHGSCYHYQEASRGADVRAEAKPSAANRNHKNWTGKRVKSSGRLVVDSVRIV